MKWLWWNGQLYPEHKTGLNVHDGAALVETLRCYYGHPFRLEQHLQRLQRWLGKLHLFAHARKRIAFETVAIRVAITEVLQANNLTRGNARVRICVTAGSESSESVCFITADAIPEEQILHWQRGIAAVLLLDSRNVSGEQPKWYNNVWHMEALRLAQTQGADEAIRFNRQGYITEGAISNVFVWHDNRLQTPPIDEGILAGITRQAVMEIAKQLGIACEEQRLPMHTLREAEGIFLTNAVREIMPVIKLQGTARPTPPIIAQLQQAYQQLVQQERQHFQ